MQIHTPLSFSFLTTSELLQVLRLSLAGLFRFLFSLISISGPRGSSKKAHRSDWLILWLIGVTWILPGIRLILRLHRSGSWVHSSPSRWWRLLRMWWSSSPHSSEQSIQISLMFSNLSLQGVKAVDMVSLISFCISKSLIHRVQHLDHLGVHDSLKSGQRKFDLVDEEGQSKNHEHHDWHEHRLYLNCWRALWNFHAHCFSFSSSTIRQSGKVQHSQKPFVGLPCASTGCKSRIRFVVLDGFDVVDA